MASEKRLNTRVINKHETEEHWRAAVNFHAYEGELIVYDVDSTHSQPRLKIGDGSDRLIDDLPFFGIQVWQSF